MLEGRRGVRTDVADDREGKKFFNLDQFKVTIRLNDWKAAVADGLARVQP